MSTINRKTASNNTATEAVSKSAPKVRRSVKVVEEPQFQLSKLPTKRLTKTVSAEKLANKRK